MGIISCLEDYLRQHMHDKEPSGSSRQNAEVEQRECDNHRQTDVCVFASAAAFCPSCLGAAGEGLKPERQTEILSTI